MQIFLIFFLSILSAPSSALSPASDVQQKAGEKSLYSLDYDDARDKFHKLIESEPDNPFGYLLEGAGIWWQATNEYGLFKDTPTLEGRFEDDIAKALEKSRALEKSSSNKQTLAEAYFIEGMALGARGQWYVLRGHWIKAFFDGKHAIHSLNKCLKLNPAFYDAYLGLGVFDYQTAHLPAILKISSLWTVRGNARRGLERLHLAYDKGHYGSIQAAMFLINIYLTDASDDAEALKLIRQLRTVFPESPYFLFTEAVTLQHLNQFDASYESALLLHKQTLADPALLGRKQLSVLCGIYGQNCLNPAGLSSSLDWLTRALQKAGPQHSTWKTLLYFYSGVTHDLLGQRAMALDDYQQSLANPAIADIHDLNHRCIETACTRDQILSILKAKSL